MECREWIERRNEEVRRRAGIERELASRADQRVLRWFGHLERMDDYRMARRVLMAKVSGGWVRGRPRLGLMDGVKVALGNRGMTVEAARQCAKDRKEWRALVHMLLNEFHAAIFTWLCVLSDRPPMLWWLSHGEMERGWMPLHDVVGINCKNCATTENQGSAVTYMG